MAVKENMSHYKRNILIDKELTHDQDSMDNLAACWKNFSISQLHRKFSWLTLTNANCRTFFGENPANRTHSRRPNIQLQLIAVGAEGDRFGTCGHVSNGIDGE